jgi:bacillithiol biosynthesis cysteine-adding enzyme BshC
MQVDFSKIPGTTKLLSDFLYDFPKVERFYAGDFRKDKNYLRAFKSINDKKYQREKLCSILLRQNQRLESPDEVFKNVELLKAEDSLVVFTGQQVGLFGGPLYTIYKAITIIKLSQALSYRFSKRFVPLFWLDSEDHDFEEVRLVYLVDKENKIKEIKYSPAKTPAGEPMYQVIFEEAVNSCIEELNISLHPTEFKDEVLKKLKECYAKEERVSKAFAKWMTAFLGRYGLVIVDPTDRELKKMGKDFFLKEIENPAKSIRLVKETGEKLESVGYHQQVVKTEETINLFLEVEGKRCSLKWNGNLIEAEGRDRKFSTEELRKIIENEPERLSPNVLLLPLMRSYLFPTVVYVGGPGEIGYYAQLKSAFEFFDIAMPLVYPRVSLSILEDKIKQVLQKYSLDFTDLFQEPEILINSVLKEKYPDPLEKLLEDKREKVREVLDDLEKELLSSGSTLKPNLKNTRKKIDYELKRLGEKLFQAHRQKNQILKEQIYKVKNNLFPQNKLQERVLNILPFLIKYGFEFIDLLYEKVDVGKIDHQIIEVK